VRRPLKQEKYEGVNCNQTPIYVPYQKGDGYFENLKIKLDRYKI
jgi:hypothetical protein